jgi:SAM-dependent methyltransferase
MVAPNCFDETFLSWINQAKAQGLDPNDLADSEWQSGLKAANQYLPLVAPTSVVLELGPGTGRLTRHILPRVSHMILADHSAFVCRFLEEYLVGKGSFVVHQIETPAFAQVPDASVDFAFAQGVFEHFDENDASFFLQDFHRVLKPGAPLAFVFSTLMTSDGLAWFLRTRGPTPGSRSIFRFYHPAMMRRLVEAAGFAAVEMGNYAHTSRHVELRAIKPGGGRSHIEVPKPWLYDVS